MDIIRNNSKEDIHRLCKIVESQGFAANDEDSEAPFESYEAQLLSEWLIETCKRVFAKT